MKMRILWVCWAAALVFSCQSSEQATDSLPVAASQNAQTAADSLPPANQQQNKSSYTPQRNVPSNLGNGRRDNGAPEYDSIQPPLPPPARNRIQIALLLDTSNSMDGLIEQAKSQLWKMVNELAKASKDEQPPQVELSLFEYGNDWLGADVGHIRMVGRLTIDLEWISDRLFKLRTNGGEEYCAWAIRDATDLLQWSDNPNDYKVIFIAGNESFTQGPVNFREVCRKAKEKGIIINTIHCGGYDEGVRESWADGATCSGGQYMNIDQGEKVVHIPTPYDDEVLKLNAELNETYIGYGRKGDSYKEMQMSNDAASAEYSSANTRTRAFYKSKSNYQNESWDLVDATAKDYDGFMDKVKKEELPEEMQKMTKEERKEHIGKLRQKRKELQSQLADLEKKVDAHIVQKKKEMAENGDAEANTLDKVMMDALHKQAGGKGFVFE